ncbi:MAG: hypothetical protein HY297_01875 [Thaumarchaeota archaeon]|nr:hypothetical protein [Nitrososphaerota archaeon]
MDLLYLNLAQGLILVFGSVVVFYALRAYRRTKSEAMLLLGLGFGFVTLGAVVAGVLFNFTDVRDLTTVETIQAASQAAGFFIIVYSLARSKN